MTKVYTLQEFKEGKILDQKVLQAIFERMNVLSKLSYFPALDNVDQFTDDVIKETKSDNVGEAYILATYNALFSGYHATSAKTFFEMFQLPEKKYMDFLAKYVNKLRKNIDDILRQQLLLDIAPDDVELKASVDNIARWYDIILENINRILNGGKNDSVSYFVHKPLRLLEDLLRYAANEKPYTDYYTQQHGILFNHVDKYIKLSSKYVKIL